MKQRNLLSESNQMQGFDIRLTFASTKHLRPRLRSGYKRKIMARDLMQGKRIYDKLKNQARQQMALMNKCRMLSRRAGRGGNLPFYLQFLNR